MVIPLSSSSLLMYFYFRLLKGKILGWFISNAVFLLGLVCYMYFLSIGAWSRMSKHCLNLINNLYICKYARVRNYVCVLGWGGSVKTCSRSISNKHATEKVKEQFPRLKKKKFFQFFFSFRKTGNFSRFSNYYHRHYWRFKQQYFE